MGKIEKEAEISKKYLLETEDYTICGKHKKLVKLSMENVGKVEAMIHTDDRYRHADDSKKEGSSAYYFEELKRVISGESIITQSEYELLIGSIVKTVNKENSTHLNADKCGENQISERLLQLELNRMLDLLRYPEETDYELLRLIEKKTEPDGDTTTGKARFGRKNTSFASKFCHYACLYLFEEDDRDKYSIYDSVVRSVLPDYMDVYSVDKCDLKDYVMYQKTIDKIIEKSESEISRKGFDHLLWYYYK